ncbi:MAG: hypothetical protein ACI9J2_001021 [Saprospiraceae bacterium]
MLEQLRLSIQLILVRVMLASFMLSPVTALSTSPEIKEVNKVRMYAGLVSLSSNGPLTHSALNHAKYLQVHPVTFVGNQGAAHFEQASQSYFTGETPSVRALSALYGHHLVLENISIGSHNVEESVRDLMSAIYHRFTFLDFDVSEIGAATVGNNYVYELGREPLRQTCESPSPNELSHRWAQCGDQKLKHQSYLNLCNDLPNEAVYHAPFKTRCRNGLLLSQSYIRSVCDEQPNGSVWDKCSGYYTYCKSGAKIQASWLDEQCENANLEVIYPTNGQYYSICDGAHKMFATWYDNYCTNLPDDAKFRDSGVFVKPCLAPHKLRDETFAALTQQARLRNPLAVIWPPDDATSVKPAFFQEDPHPTPDKDVTGYPISVQFNPTLVDKAVINFFTLEKLVSNDSEQPLWEAVTQIRAINANSDINELFNSHQFAWFPEERLDWNSRYRYVISAQLDGNPHELRANFSTQSLQAKLVELELDTESVRIKQDHFILYQKPTLLEPQPFKNVRFAKRGFTKLSVELIDPSTLEVWLSRTACLPVELLFSSGRHLTIQPCF